MQLGATLKDMFGGSPGWLAAVPVGQQFDLAAGSTRGPAGSYTRTPSGRWLATGVSAPFDVVVGDEAGQA